MYVYYEYLWVVSVLGRLEKKSLHRLTVDMVKSGVRVTRIHIDPHTHIHDEMRSELAQAHPREHIRNVLQVRKCRYTFVSYKYAYIYIYEYS